MGDAVPLNSEEKCLRDQLVLMLETIDKKISVFSSDKKYFSQMCKVAHYLHLKLCQRGHEPKHHLYMIKNRGCKPEEREFYKHLDPIRDLIAFTFDINANDDTEDLIGDHVFPFNIEVNNSFYKFEIIRFQAGFILKWKNTDTTVSSSSLDSYVYGPYKAEFLQKNCDMICPHEFDSFMYYLFNQTKKRTVTIKVLAEAIEELRLWLCSINKNVPKSEFWKNMGRYGISK